jgi:hypothetical protein
MDIIIIGCIVAFLLLIVLGMQIQLNALSSKMEENINSKLDELLRKKVISNNINVSNV